MPSREEQSKKHLTSVGQDLEEALEDMLAKVRFAGRRLGVVRDGFIDEKHNNFAVCEMGAEAAAAYSANKKKLDAAEQGKRIAEMREKQEAEKSRELEEMVEKEKKSREAAKKKAAGENDYLRRMLDALYNKIGK